MSRHISWSFPVGLIVGTTAGLLCAGDSAAGADSASAAELELLRAVLGREAGGVAVDRKALLAPAIAAHPDDAGLRWQSGYVKQGDQWVPLELAAEAARSDAVLREYLRQRDAVFQTPAGHLDLANWCRRQGLADQERAHLNAALEGDFDNATIRARLGQRQVDGWWMTRAEIASAERESKDMARNLKLWKPRIESILNRLTSSSGKRNESARADLSAIDAPEAIPAIEQILGSHSEEIAREMVRQLHQRASLEATQALTRQSVVSPWKSIRKAAAESLGRRRIHNYAPSLLGLLYTPVSSQYRIYLGPLGGLHFTHLLEREGKDHREVATFQRNDFRPAIFIVTQRNSDRIRYDILDMGRVRQRNDTRRELRDIAVVRQAEIDRHNERTAELNTRIQEALSTATGQSVPEAATGMWQWWLDYNEVAVTGNKRVFEVSEEETIGQPRTVRAAPAAWLNSTSCLAAGTLIPTSRGDVPIEQVRIGDQVLAKDVESGELAFKPVLLTTIREPRPLVRIQLSGGGTITATGGHPFWISGRGWTRARDLAVGMVLHAATGALSIASVEPAEPEPTYNLIVDGFHSYFVGAEHVLSHDNTVIEPTAAAVPGLAAKD